MMKTRISLLCCVFLLALGPAAWAAPPASGDCATNFQMASVGAPQALTAEKIEKLSPLAGAQQAQTSNCCTQQDWNECVAILQPSCWIEEFYCFQGQFCYCGINCY